MFTSHYKTSKIFSLSFHQVYRLYRCLTVRSCVRERMQVKRLNRMSERKTIMQGHWNDKGHTHIHSLSKPHSVECEQQPENIHLPCGYTSSESRKKWWFLEGIQSALLGRRYQPILGVRGYLGSHSDVLGKRCQTFPEVQPQHDCQSVVPGRRHHMDLCVRQKHGPHIHLDFLSII